MFLVSMDDSLEFVLLTQGFSMSDLDFPLAPVTVDLTKDADCSSQPLAGPPISPAAPVCKSSDDEVRPTDKSPHDQTLTFIDFVSDM